MQEAEIILFVVDVTDGISPKDKVSFSFLLFFYIYKFQKFYVIQQISQMLRKHGKNKKVIVVVNKVDNSVRERDAEVSLIWGK